MSAVTKVLPTKDAYVKGVVLTALALATIVIALKVMPAAWAAKARAYLFPV